MTCYSSIEIGVPEGCAFPSVENAAALRALSITDVLNGDNYAADGGTIIGDGLGGVYVFVAGSVETDDGRAVLKPTSLTSLQAGRWKLIDSSAVYNEGSAGAVPRSIVAKLRDFTATVTDFGAVGDGVTNTRAAFVAADAAGPLVVPEGLFYIASSLTITNAVTFLSGARLVIPTGVTVTFSKAIIAPVSQIFNIGGTGAVAGLFDAWFEWFAGDAKSAGNVMPGVECRSALDKFAAALNTSGIDYVTRGGAIARFGPGSWLINGASGTVFHNCSIQGAGSGQTVFMWTGSATSGFDVIGNRAAYCGFQFMPAVGGTIPISGAAMAVRSRNSTFSDIIVNDAFGGWDVQASSGSNTYHGCPVYSALSYGRKVNGSEHHFTDCHVVAIPDWATLSAAIGLFQVGNVVAIANSSGVITDDFGGGKYKIAWTGNRPVPPAALTNSTTGGTAMLSSNTPAHNVAAVLWYTTSMLPETGNITDDSDIIGGDWGLVGQGVNANNVSANPAWCRTGQNFCADTTYYGSKIDKCYGWKIAGWFSSTRNINGTGLRLTNSNDIALLSPQCVNNAGQGLYIDETNYFVDISSPMSNGNCWNISTTVAMAEIALVTAPGAVVHDITLTGGKSGYPDLFGRTPNLGLYVGNSDGTTGATASRVSIVNHNVANGKALINATQINGTNQRLRIVALTGVTDQ